MIAVVANPSERPLVSEFFELFKTPWEFYRKGRRYDVVLCAGSPPPEGEGAAKLVLVYSSRPLSGSSEVNVAVSASRSRSRILCYHGTRFPIYGDCVRFPQSATSIPLIDEETREPVACLALNPGTSRARIGYDLFGEIRTLLTKGQPPEHAGIPTVELHIALLRDLIIASGNTLVEIPPVPDNYSFIACLTHDVDHPSIRNHRFDHTMFGFLYRAIFGSLVDVFKRRASVLDLLRNWLAVLKLPLVYLHLANDFWHRFQEYPALENGLPSSFFVIPFKGRPGQAADQPAPSHRAAGYAAAEIALQIQKLKAVGCEVGLHGIDAWLDSSLGREELEEIRRITGAEQLGVRMHWLYFDDRSPENLETAGATYDSTVGYNETVGYRAGTTQVYKPLRAARLLELPLHVMDTALFYPDRLNLSPREARTRVDRLIGQVAHLGGCLTFNWHDRSIAPERQWTRFYQQTLSEMQRKGAWFSTAANAVAWFQKRRSAVFQTISCESNCVRVQISVQGSNDLPGLRLRIFHPNKARDLAAPCAPMPCHSDITLIDGLDTCTPLDTSEKPNSAAEATPTGPMTTYAS